MGTLEVRGLRVADKKFVETITILSEAIRNCKSTGTYASPNLVKLAIRAENVLTIIQEDQMSDLAELLEKFDNDGKCYEDTKAREMWIGAPDPSDDFPVFLRWHPKYVLHKIQNEEKALLKVNNGIGRES